MKNRIFHFQTPQAILDFRTILPRFYIKMTSNLHTPFIVNCKMLKNAL